jgi:hypothetical protein
MAILNRDPRKNFFIFVDRGIIYALLLLWLALTGSFEGWYQLPLLWLNGLASVLILLRWAWLLKRGQPWRPLSLPLLIYLLVASVATLITPGDGMINWYYRLVLVAIYHVADPDIEELGRGAFFAGWIVTPLAFLLPWENGNSLAFVLWGLFFMSLAYKADYRLGFLTLGIIAFNGSEGGVLAMLAGLLAWAAGRRPGMFWPAFSLAGIVGGAIIIDKYASHSLWNRLEIYQSAWSGFLQSPWWGNGLHSFYTVLSNGSQTLGQHNLVLWLLWETGLIGLVIGLWLVISLARPGAPAWALAWLVAFATHAMVDNPLQHSFLVGAVLMLILAGCYGQKQAYLFANPEPMSVGHSGAAVQS